MKKTHVIRFLFAFLGTIAPLWIARAQTTFFSDNFSNGSTTNEISMPGGSPTASFTSYDFASTKNALAANSIQPNDLRMALASATSSGFIEYQALFATNAISLNAVGDYIELDVIFTNTTDTIFSGTATGSSLDLGLYNSGSIYGQSTNYPVPDGALGNSGLAANSGSSFATGNCEPWQGYVGQILSNSAPQILTRPAQTGTGTTSANQDLLGAGAGGGLYVNPGAVSLFKGANTSVTIPATGPCTVTLRITETAQGILTISNALYQGVGTSGTVVYSQIATGVTGANDIASAFDGLGIGIRSVSVSTADGVIPIMDISSISVFGQSTIPTGPPTINQQPVDTTVTTNGSCAFSVTATGDNVTYQWYRNNTKLSNGGNLSGVTSDLLVVSPATTADQFTGPSDGYYCDVSGAGGFSIDTTTNTLTLIASTNLVWSGTASTWDVDTTPAWQDTNTPPDTSLLFNFGDPVTFNDVGGPAIITVAGSYVSPSSITVSGSSAYEFEGSGSIAGPTVLNDFSGAFLTFDSANSYTGGTVISNAAAYVLLNNYGGLGSGPVTLALAGGQMEFPAAGSGTVGVEGNVVINDNFTMLADADSTFAVVLLGNVSGTPGKTLTISANTPTNPDTNQWRVRVLGGSTTNNANLDLNDANLLWASYQSSGSQTYNGVISGPGGFIEKGTITYLNGNNTFTGGAIPAQGAIGLGVSSVGTWPTLTSSPLGTGPLLLFVDSSSSTAGNGFIFATINNLTLGNAIQYSSGTNNLTLDIGGSDNITLTGPFTLYGNDHSTNTAFPTRSLEVTNTGLTTFTGVISDGGSNYNFNLTGSGVTLFNNTETYGGTTTNSGGVLLVNGSIGSGLCVIQTNATLGGVGTVGGPVLIQSGGTLTAGSQTVAHSQQIGTLSLSSSLTFLAGSTNFVQVNTSLGTPNTVIDVTGAVTNNGTLYAVNVGPALSAGNSFHVINAGSYTGSFTTVAGSPGAGLAWSYNSANGVLSVVQGVSPFTVPPGITNITFSGSNIITAGTNAQANAIYYLLTSTNLQSPLSQWIPVGTNITSTANSFNFTNNAVGTRDPHRFYILSNTNF